MIKYALGKIAYGLFVLLGVIMLVFYIFNVLPVDAGNLTIGQSSDVETEVAVRKELGLDKSLPAQFLNYLNDLSPISVHDKSESNKAKYGGVSLLTMGKKYLLLKKPYLRRSYQTKRPVSEILMKAVGQTLLLAFISIVFASISGIALGAISATKQHSWLDQLLTFVSTIGVSVPSFFSALVIGFLFGNLWAHITGLNQTGSLIEINNLGEKQIVIKNLLLPALALGIRPISIIFQLTRSSMLDVLNKDYIRTAKAKGLSKTKIMIKHALRNALNPVITSITGWFASLLAGAFFVEIIFNIKGIGYVTIDSMQKFDFPVVMGAIMIIATVFVIANILADLVYGWLDPRVRV